MLLFGEVGVDLKMYGKMLFEIDVVCVWVDDCVGEDDVVIVLFKLKMNMIGLSVIDGFV